MRKTLTASPYLIDSLTIATVTEAGVFVAMYSTSNNGLCLALCH
ncbi:hypothetical protein [Pantoea dispersa]|nr:hypothetical protein [Pantoea dispersa]MDI6632966.1 hypothetical protein [Pantoea dispersa]